MKRIRKSISFVLALLMLLSLMPAAAYASGSGECGENIQWTLDDSGVLTVSGSGRMPDYEEGASPFYGLGESIRSIVISEGITYIGDNTFRFSQGEYLRYYSVQALSLPSTLEDIGDYAFYYALHLGNDPLLIPDGVKTVGDYAFYGCAYQYVILGKSVETFGDYAFSRIRLSNATNILTIPLGIKNIGEGCFDKWTVGFYDVKFTGTREQWQAISIGSKNEVLTDSIVTCTDGKYTAVLQSGTIGDSISWELRSGYVLYVSGSGAIPAYAQGESPFSTLGVRANNVIISEGITSVGSYAFYNAIGPDNTNSLELLVLPDSLKTIEDHAFYQCKFMSYDLGDGVETIGDYAFMHTLGDDDSGIIVFPASLKSVGESVFTTKAFSEVKYGGTAEQWQQISFGSDNEVFLDKTVQCSDGKYVHDIASGSCGESLTWTVNSDRLLKISGTGDMYSSEDAQFTYYGQILNIVIEEGVTSIDTFMRCPEYCRSITIPASVTKIAAGVFSSVPDSVYFSGTASQWAQVDIGENNTIKGMTIRCSDKKFVPIVDSGKCGENLSWYLDGNGLLVITGTGEMYDYGEFPYNTQYQQSPWSSYRYNSSISELRIEAGVTSVGAYAFYYCSNIKNAVLPDGLESIGENAFYVKNFYSYLININIPSSVTSVGKNFLYADYNCTLSYGGTKENWDTLISKAENNFVNTVTVHCSDGDLVKQLITDSPCGEGFTVSLDTNHVLTIKGSGYLTAIPKIDYPVDEIHFPAGLTGLATGVLSGLKPYSDSSAVKGYFEGTKEQWKLIDEEAMSDETLMFMTVTCSDGVYARTMELPLDGNISMSICMDGHVSITGDGELTVEMLENFGDEYPLAGLFSELYMINGNASGVLNFGKGITGFGDRVFFLFPSWVSLEYEGTVAEWKALPLGEGNASLVGHTVHCADGDYTYTCEDFSLPISYTIEDGVLTVSGNVEIPDMLFIYNSEIRKAVIGSGITGIGMAAFGLCENLEEITLPESLTKIGSSAFYGTALKNVYYIGSEENFGKIDIQEYNDPLNAAEMHFRQPEQAIESEEDEEAPASGVVVPIDANLPYGTKLVIEDVPQKVSELVKEAVITELGDEYTYKAIEISLENSEGNTVSPDEDGKLEVDKLDHSPAEAVREKEVAATCQTAGSYEAVVYCSVCKTEISRTPMTTSLAAHTFAEGKCINCPATEPYISVNSHRDISVGESAVFTATVKYAPEGARVKWIVGENCSAAVSGDTCTVTGLNAAEIKITVKLVDINGEEITEGSTTASTVLRVTEESEGEGDFFTVIIKLLRQIIVLIQELFRNKLI